VPSNFGFGTNFAGLLNGLTVAAEIDYTSHQITFENVLPEESSFTVEIIAGLFNPKLGPYNYDYF